MSMSVSLRERLKRSSRYRHQSLAPKRLCDSILPSQPAISPSAIDETVCRMVGSPSALRSADDVQPLVLTPMSNLLDRECNRSNQQVSPESRSKTAHQTATGSRGLDEESLVLSDKCLKLTTLGAAGSHPTQPVSTRICRLASPLVAMSPMTPPTQINQRQTELPLTHRKNQLRDSLQQKTETLRKLQLVKLYRTKRDQVDVDVLTSKWRQVSQQAVSELWSDLPSPQPPLTEFINRLQLDHKLIGYDADEETFVDPF